MLPLLLTLTFSEAVDSLYRLYSHIVSRTDMEPYLRLGLTQEEARRAAFAELLFSADSGLLGIRYRNNSTRGLYHHPMATLRRLGKVPLYRDCDEIAPIGAAALRALGLPAVVGFYSIHAVVVIPRRGKDIVVDFSFPSASPYGAEWEFYKGYFYDSLSYWWMRERDKRYAEAFPRKVNAQVDSILGVDMDGTTFNIWKGLVEKRAR